MKKSRFSEEQIIGILKEQQAGLPPEKWSSLRYGFEPCGGSFHGTEEAYG